MCLRVCFYVAQSHHFIRMELWTEPLETKLFRYHADAIKCKHFRLTGLFLGESTGHQWIILAEANDAELLYFIWSAPQWTND